MLASTLDATEYAGYQIQPDHLGVGFDSDMATMRQACLQGDWIETGNVRGELNYLSSQTAEAFIEQTYGKVKGGINLILFAGSVSTSLSSRVTENRRSASSSIRLIYDARDLSLENRTLTPLGQSMVGADPMTILSTCGDAFIHHIKLGSEIYVTTRLHFRSVEEYQKWVTKIKVRFLFYSKTKTKTKEWLKLTENAVYSIDVNTQGGMTPRLQELLDQNPRYCQTDAMTDCETTLEKLFDYLFSPSGYAQDIESAPKTVLSMNTQTYQASAHFGLVADPLDRGAPFTFENERLSVRFVSNQQSIATLDAFIAVETDDSQREAYENTRAKAVENIQWLDEAAEDCRQTTLLAFCRQQVDAALARQHNLNEF
ncbi:hypothetical protein MED297_11120 [Reinekea sp. MED297]|uniref:Uncharacterized protein n=2 Tax=Reinekea TaxID=230494 RepID=A4BAU9_9GAMM|nr:hypothetical protein MED297_11120 [Reinekea sp. MED297] [Reinekea blandensis MED297]